MLQSPALPMTEDELSEIELALHSSPRFEEDPNYSKFAQLLGAFRELRERAPAAGLGSAPEVEPAIPAECPHGWNPTDCLACVETASSSVSASKPKEKARLNESKLTPRTRKVVAWLRERGFEVESGGDGDSDDPDIDGPYVHMVVSKGQLVIEADRLFRLLSVQSASPEPPSVLATYNPADDTSTLSVFNITL